jgi:hypothetical protein
VAPSAVLLEHLLSTVIACRLSRLGRSFLMGLLLRAICLRNGHGSYRGHCRRKQWKSKHDSSQVFHRFSFSACESAANLDSGHKQQ